MHHKIVILYFHIIIGAEYFGLCNPLESSFRIREGGHPKFPLRLDSKGSCGVRQIYHSPPKNKFNEPTLKIVGGGPVPYGAYPWTAHLESLSFEGFDHSCGGTIVSEYFVITAAHCVHGYSFREVRVKVGDFDSDVKEKSEKVYEVHSWRVHPDFQKGGTYNNDIAVVKIKAHQGHGIQYDDFVSAACLPDQTTSYNPGTWCYISGWGFTQPDQFYPSYELRAATVPLISDKICRSPDILGPKKLKPGMICAGYLQGEIDACNGDSGGPLVCEIDGQHTLLGVVSWGIDCAKRNKPGVYANVQYYMNFIHTAMEEL